MNINFNTPKWEAVKDVARWAIFFAFSWVITETLKQISLVPEWYTLNVWVFSYAIPIRLMLQLGLTFAGGFADKYKFEMSKKFVKLGLSDQQKPSGIIPF